MRRLLATIAAVAVPAVLLAVLPAQSAMAATKTMTGTIEGADGRAVNFMLGFDVHRADGSKIDLDGDGTGYSKKIYGNSSMNVNGAPKSSSTVTTWSLTMPSDAANVWIEVYPNRPVGVTPYQPPQTRYGPSMRRGLPPTSRNVALRLPVKCGFAGGTTGGIKGRVTKAGRVVTPVRTRAWSLAPDSATNTKILGWNMGVQYATTSLYQGYYSYVVPNLASAQGYVVWVTVGTTTIRKKISSVSACKGTTVNFAF